MASQLPISTLTYATSAVRYSIGSCAPNHTLSPVKLSDFTLTSIVGISSDKTQVGYGDTITFRLTYTGEKPQFFNIKKIPSNFIFDTISYPGAGYPDLYYSLVSETEDTRTYKNVLSSYKVWNFKNTGGVFGSSTVWTELSYDNTSIVAQVYLKFFDKTYNQDAINYNTYLQTAVTLYRPPKPSLSYYTAVGPPRPCCGNIYSNGTCCDAYITINYASNSPVFGVYTNRLDLYYKESTNTGYTLFSTVYNDTGRATKSSLKGNTTYQFKAINNIGVESDVISVTTPAYV
jgi:hypothetical protein